MLVWGWLLEKQRVQTKPKTQTSSSADLEGGHNRGPHFGGASVRRRKTLLTIIQ
jgi:hypothetical protein